MNTQSLAAQTLQWRSASPRPYPTTGGPPSWQSRCIERVLRSLRAKQRWGSPAAVHRAVCAAAARPTSHAPVGLGRDVQVRLSYAEGWPVYRTAPLHMQDDGSGYVVFLHGGGYFKEIVRAHWRIVGRLTREARARCIVPIYPLAPRATARDLVPATGALLRDVLRDAGAAEVTVVGNSAGAGLALAAAQWLRDRGHRQPDALVLVSPGVNAALDTPQRAAIAGYDPLQDLAGILEAAKLYAGDLDLAHPYVSPLNGGLRGLAPMLIFSGTHDLLYPDSVDLAERARACEVPVELHLRLGQPHNYAAMPTPEGREAMARIVRFIAQRADAAPAAGGLREA
ncbi:alpha/beta fold hydrolase [Lysobacter sp. K5869]|uniref:alpha/beta fold hydrolase n=1 Tax=Lysobacter sp. K5869 TaxID=2820808 RepID=UPI001C05EDCE|nr:alpha/beta fold hydrolase [Lysobacter sp. K5869]QWP77118.1 alpha/beta fold hydrolase [Lysobacter sp. K5869]